MAVSPQEVARVRAFNRDYTRRIGVLARSLLDSPYSLTEARVLYEIAHRPGITASTLTQELDLDPGYLSRILKRFAARRLLSREPSPGDARRHHLQLTAAGRRAFEPLERRSEEQVRGMFQGLDEPRRATVLSAMASIAEAFAGPAQAAVVQLREPRPGDLGWVVARHGALYAAEYGWDLRFEALVAGIVAQFVERRDAPRERCWIAERAGVRLGSVFLVDGGEGIAKLRLLLVEPEARGAGLGRLLVRTCVEFARSAGYRGVTLWTQSILAAARRLYVEAGFTQTRAEAHESFGHALIGETWDLDLTGPRGKSPAP
jgi:DNA-binding MarR family transcriptional regulator/N-acetylglutamate synthase-like GNAT family acetyltransferase